MMVMMQRNRWELTIERMKEELKGKYVNVFSILLWTKFSFYPLSRYEMFNISVYVVEIT